MDHMKKKVLKQIDNEILYIYICINVSLLSLAVYTIYI